MTRRKPALFSGSGNCGLNKALNHCNYSQWILSLWVVMEENKGVLQYIHTLHHCTSQKSLRLSLGAILWFVAGRHLLSSRLWSYRLMGKSLSCVSNFVICFSVDHPPPRRVYFSKHFPYFNRSSQDPTPGVTHTIQASHPVWRCWR